MSHIDGTMEYELKRGVKYSKGGEFIEATFVELKEFGPKNRKHYLKLKKMIDRAFFSAIPEIEKLNEIKSLRESAARVEEGDGDDIYAVLKMGVSMSSEVDLDDFVELFKGLVCNSDAPLCKLDGEVKIKPEVFSDMHPDDQLEVAYKYCAFFGVGLDSMRDAGSNSATTRQPQAKAL